MARLNGIQRTLAIRPSNFLLNLENSLLKELDMVMNQEKELWALKSRVDWMIQGEWLLEEDEVKEFVKNGFNEDYTTSLLSSKWVAPKRSQWQVSLTEEEKTNISGVATEDEVKSALWSLKAFKALGPDGLHAGFFQRFWLIVGKSVTEEVKKGQTVSEAKSRVYFSPNVDRDTRESLCDILGFASTPKLGKYLSFPIKQPRTSTQDYNFILDRVKQKLVGWKVNLLSLTGRAVLIQASSATILAYVMQCTQLLGRILEVIDQVNRNFLWGSLDSTRKMHWIGWNKVTKPKEEGGLGLQTAKGRNIALLVKLNWRLDTEKEALWAKALRQKYCNQRRMNAANADRLPCSHIWIAIKKGKEVFSKGKMWRVRRESNLNFWTGNWTKKRTP
ncbi:uncharacterized protein LOC142639417 [Castanea sativa]|uniref:uncharacterized protein LOC142639417 n=1 Tax=Castanea sativa TaxID=21020 RepID=UPI003F651D46